MTMNVISPDASMDDLLGRAALKFGKLAFEPVRMGDSELNVLQIKDMPGYIEKIVAKVGPKGKVDLPLWAKIWPSCLIMSMFMARHSLSESASVLEVGAGGGLAGLSLALRGYNVTLSDIEPDARLFSHINAMKNGLQDRVEVVATDFTRDDLERKFDLIMGCEVIYKEEHAAPLVDFLDRHLADSPEAEVIMAMDLRRTGKVFFEAASTKFKVMLKEVPFKDKQTNEEHKIVIYRLRAK